LRPIDLHLKALKRFGARITEDHGYIICEAKRLRGAKINLDFPSVGATENIMLTAVTAKGETILSNAAREPEIIDLQNFLNSMGADVRGAGSGTIVIKGKEKEKLHSAEHTVMPDRIVAGTYMAAAAITGGHVTLTNVNTQHLEPVTSKFVEAGCTVREYADKITLKAPDRIKPISRLITSPHPGFPTDVQPQFMAMLALANGTSMIEETVFESRTKHVSELIRLGADILVAQDGMTAIVKGVKSLTGATVAAKDLRGGAALILAGLAAEGTTTVTNAKHIERGYEHIEKTLTQLGAKITYHA
jgi:UDP-N-acetylglucosamine 1-carboxyvinyltransferase